MAEQRQRQRRWRRRPAAAARRRWRPRPRAALHSRPDAGSTTAPATDAPVAHRRHRHRVPGHAVEEVHRAVDRVDHPARCAGCRPPRRRAPPPPPRRRDAARPSRRADQRLQRVVGRGHHVGRRALGRHAVAPRGPRRRLVPRPGQPAQVLGRLGDDALGDPAQRRRRRRRGRRGGRTCSVAPRSPAHPTTSRHSVERRPGERRIGREASNGRSTRSYNGPVPDAGRPPTATSTDGDPARYPTTSPPAAGAHVASRRTVRAHRSERA